MPLLLPVVAIVVGFVALVWGADRFVEGAAATARNLGISPLIIGLVVVGFGTSAPEMLVSAIAAYENSGGISVGNAIGSNVTNVGAALGLTAIVSPLVVHSSVLRKELPLLFGTMLLAYVLVRDGELSRLDGGILVTGLVLMVGSMVRAGLASRGADGAADALAEEFDAEIPSDMPTGKALMWLFVGLVVLIISARAVVWGAVEVATAFGVSDLIIGLTIIAFGTSLPEIAASVVSATKNEHDIAIGNVVGSNMFNLLGVLALPGLVRNTPVDADAINRDFPVMFALTILLLVLAKGFKKEATVSRVGGAMLLLSFVVYTGVLFANARGIDVLAKLGLA